MDISLPDELIDRIAQVSNSTRSKLSTVRHSYNVILREPIDIEFKQKFPSINDVDNMSDKYLLPTLRSWLEVNRGRKKGNTIYNELAERLLELSRSKGIKMLEELAKDHRLRPIDFAYALHSTYENTLNKLPESVIKRIVDYMWTPDAAEENLYNDLNYATILTIEDLKVIYYLLCKNIENGIKLPDELKPYLLEQVELNLSIGLDTSLLNKLKRKIENS